jgi:hypothetical protein
MAGELLLYVPFANGRVITYALPETVVKALEQDRKGRKAIAEKVAKIRENVGKVAPLVPTGVNLLNADASGGRSATSTNVTNRGATTSSSNLRVATTSMALHKSASYTTTRATKEEIADAAIEPTFLSSRSPGFRVDNPVLISPLGLLFSGKSNETLTLRRDPENPSFKFATAAPLAMPPSQFGDSGYFACDDGAVYAVDLAKGKPLWHFAAPSPLKEPMIVTDTGVFGAMRQGGVLMIDRARGNEAWTQPEAQKLVAISKNYVYAYDRIDRLLVLDRATGIVLTQFDMSKFNVPFVNERTDRVILAANDGSLICLRDQGQTEPLRHEVPQAATKADDKKTIKVK